MMRRTAVLLASLAFGLAASLDVAPLLAQSAVTDEDASAAITILDAAPGRARIAALHKSGRPAANLKPSSLLIREDDGRLQPVAAVTPFVDDQQPLSIVIVLDNSSVMTGALRSTLLTALQDSASALRPDDRLSVISTGSSATQSTVAFPDAVTTDPTTALDYIERLLAKQAGAPGLNDRPLYDAVLELAPPQEDFDKPAPRHFVLLFGTGKRPTGVDAANRFDAVLHTRDIDYPMFTYALIDGDDAPFLRRIAAQTHGEYVRAVDAAALRSTIVRTIDHMRTNFELRYATHMPNDWPAHHIAIVSLHSFGRPAGALIPAAHPTAEPRATPLHTEPSVVRSLRTSVAAIDAVLEHPRWHYIALASFVGAALGLLVPSLRRKFARHRS